MAITLPFYAHVLTFKRTAKACAITLVCIGSLNCCAFYVFTTAPAPGTSATNCLLSSAPGTTVLESVMFVISYVVPNCSLLVLTAVALAALKRYQARSLSLRSAQGNGGRRENLSSMKSVVAMACVRCTVYVPYSLSGLVASRLNNYISDLLTNVAFIFLMLTGFCQIFDFVVYVATVPQFRAKICSIIHCNRTASS